MFINIVQDAAIGLPELQDVPKQDGSEPQQQYRFPASCGEVRDDFDKQNDSCLVVDVCFHPNTLLLCQQQQALKFVVCSIAVEHIRKKFQVTINEDFAFPKMRYKGGERPVKQRIRQTNKQQAIDNQQANKHKQLLHLESKQKLSQQKEEPELIIPNKQASSITRVDNESSSILTTTTEDLLSSLGKKKVEPGAAKTQQNRMKSPNETKEEPTKKIAPLIQEIEPHASHKSEDISTAKKQPSQEEITLDFPSSSFAFYTKVENRKTALSSQSTTLFLSILLMKALSPKETTLSWDCSSNELFLTTATMLASSRKLQRYRISFPCPIDSSSAKIRLIKNKRKIIFQARVNSASAIKSGNQTESTQAIEANSTFDKQYYRKLGLSCSLINQFVLPTL